MEHQCPGECVHHHRRPARDDVDLRPVDHHRRGTDHSGTLAKVGDRAQQFGRMIALDTVEFETGRKVARSETHEETSRRLTFRCGSHRLHLVAPTKRQSERFGSSLDAGPQEVEGAAGLGDR